MQISMYMLRMYTHRDAKRRKETQRDAKRRKEVYGNIPRSAVRRARHFSVRAGA
eukprot:COSAG03_NODE_2618_length_2590_cov_13.661582_4_plen_54_part_00